MLKRLRNNFGIPGILAIAALVFAMIGGAYAASDPGGKATASAKGRKGPPGPRGKRGPTGPAGPAGAPGAQGPAGAKGDAGSAGANGGKGSTGATGPTGPTGTSGASGQSVKVKALTAGLQAECEETGGALVEEEDGNPKVPVCNGEQGEDGDEGQPWTPDNTLPAGATLTGSWSVNASPATAMFESFAFAPISFPIELKGPLDASKVHYEGDANFATTCPGSPSAEDPQAASGHLCVYEGTRENLTAPTITSLSFSTSKEANKAGALLFFEVGAANAVGFGSWAVTGF